jgi:cobyrinic acid a,c-diamide synthase
MPCGFLLAAPSGGAGKTTAATALVAAFARRGVAVQPFKVGPDFLDPTYLAAAAGRPCHTLDLWMAGEAAVRDRAARAAAGADLVVVEGMMGLFDGVEARGDAGSSAAAAKLLGLPVVLVVDASAAARSVAALAHGFATFDPDVVVAGVIATKTGGAGHVALLRDALASAGGPPLLGALPYEPAAVTPERHLGLYRAEEAGPDGRPLARRERLDRLAALAERHVDLERVARLEPDPGRWPRAAGPAGGHAGRAAGPGRRPARRPEGPAPVIGVARDAAFSFYYPANLEWLAAQGATLKFFSPLADPGPPAGAGALYFGGGYPELHAAALAANRPMREAVRAFVDAGRPVYAECGGLMYLADRLVDARGEAHAMAGALPGAATAMGAALPDFGYVEVETVGPTPLGPEGRRLRGHRFHASRLVSPPADARRAYRLRRPDGADWGEEGFLRRNLLASYVHLLFDAAPDVAAALAGAAARREGGV